MAIIEAMQRRRIAIISIHMMVLHSVIQLLHISLTPQWGAITYRAGASVSMRSDMHALNSSERVRDFTTPPTSGEGLSKASRAVDTSKLVPRSPVTSKTRGTHAIGIGSAASPICKHTHTSTLTHRCATQNKHTNTHATVAHTGNAKVTGALAHTQKHARIQ